MKSPEAPRSRPVRKRVPEEIFATREWWLGLDACEPANPTMKTIATTTLLLLGTLALQAGPFRPPGGPGGGMPPRGGGGPGPGEARHVAGDLSELAAKKDKFDAFRRYVLMGTGTYTKQDGRLLHRHVEIYNGIEMATNGERLGEEQAEKFIDELLAIGEKAVAARGEAEALSEESAKEIATSLDDLAKRARTAASNKVNGEVLTPDLNRSQWTMRELVRFGKSGGLSTSRVGSLDRQLDALLAKEDRAKADGKLTDREREDLFKDALEIWRDLLKAIV